MDRVEIRLKLLELATRQATAHPQGYAVGALEMAKAWEEWVSPGEQKPQQSETLRLPKK